MRGSMEHMELTKLKKDYAAATKRGVPILMGGLLYWLVGGLSAVWIPQDVSVWVFLFGMGVVFPLGILIGRLMGIDLFAKGNPLGPLTGIIGGLQILFAPLVVYVLYADPSWLPFTIAVLAGAHFLPLMWVYESRSYVFLSVGTVLASAAAALVMKEEAFTIIPFAVFVVYLITIAGLTMENKRVHN